jgi:alginate O-acetyltransferase complex protein AlgI
MLFNSNEFIYAFLPVALAGYFAVGIISRTWALSWLICVSLFFYAWWRPFNVALIAPSIFINFVLARFLERLGESKIQSQWSRLVLLLGIAFNIAFLGYFKYINFFESIINDVFGENLILTELILPLGISFITFQKIAFLIDVQARRVRSFTLRDYALFVLFFPQLIAGPIVHFKEMIPQFRNTRCRFDKENFAVGLTLFFFGMFKKVALADHVAPLVTPIYEKASSGGGISFLLAWMAAIGFTMQIYFDFSGYSDMALGLARFFGVRLPPNFNSPLQASNIIDFWQRWHMTLTRFLMAYIYSPLQLWLMRRRLAKSGPAGGRNMTAGTFVKLLMFPMLLTMFLSGLWHGAGYVFIVFGLLHGIYLTINHGWRMIVPKLWLDRASYERFMTPLGVVLTFVAVATANVFFRSSSMTAAFDLLKGMIGLNGITLPETVYDHFGPISGVLDSMGVVRTIGGGQDFIMLMIWILILMFIALGCPNTLEVLARYEPAIGVKPRPTEVVSRRVVEWSPSLPWAIIVSAIATIGILSLGSPSEFLYWQF